MRQYINTFAAACLLAGIAATSCSPDEYDLGAPDYTSDDLVAGIAYTITPDASNPNIIYLESLLPSSYSCVWSHPQGRSQDPRVTLRMPFPGTYSVVFGIETRAGVVMGDTATFTIDGFCSDFVNNEYWTAISGGVGKSKKWIVDNGKYGFGGGEMTYANPNKPQEFNHWEKNWDPGYNYTKWGEAEMAASYMIFDLVGGANVQVFDGKNTWQGTYMLDTDNFTLSFTDAVLLHSPTYENTTSNWKNGLTIFELDENHMRVGVLREKATSGQDPWWVIWNFVSEDYANSFVYVAPEVYPKLAADWRDYFEQKTNREITYLLNDDVPYDWCNLDGSNKSIGINASPYLEDFSLTLRYVDAETRVYSCEAPGGGSTSGTYTLDENGIFEFSPALPSFALDKDGKVMFDAPTQLRLMNYDVDSYSGKLTYAWLGVPEVDDAGKTYQYQAIQLVPKQEGGAVERYVATLRYFDKGWGWKYAPDLFVTGDGIYTATIEDNHGGEPYGLYLDIEKLLLKHPNCDIIIKDVQVDGVTIEFSDELIDRGNGSSSGIDGADARRYIVNPWGATAGNASMLNFETSLSVTFQVIMDNGVPFIASAE